MHNLTCYHNGKYLQAEEIQVSPWDLGFLRGLGVFDVLPVIGGKAFLWEWHYERLARSAESLGIALSISKEAYEQILTELIIKNGQNEGLCFRTILSGGVSQDAFTPELTCENFMVLTEELHGVSRETIETGAKLLVLDHVRTFPRVKMTHYVNAIKTLPERKAAGALETLYVQDGQVSECAQSNFFIVKNGVVITTNENALLGITQKLILEVLAPELALKTEVRTLLFEEVLQAEEAFLTGSNKGVVPVVWVGEHTISDGHPGPITEKLRKAYNNYLKAY